MEDALKGAVIAPRPTSIKRRPEGWWLAGAALVALLVLTPLIAVVWIAFNPAENIWPHLAETMLPRYLKNTFGLMLGVAAGTIVIGVGTAWLVTMCRFPGKRLFEWALLLPLACPAYVVAYVYTDMLEFAGPVQKGLRALFGWETARDYWFFDIRTMGGAIAVLTLVLYPYVYMLTRAAFLAQSVCVLEASRVLGRGPWRSFFTVALPLARPAIVVGVALCLMETLNDFGTIDYFGVHTLTAGIFNVWLGMRNVGGAAQIALVMLAFVIALLMIERGSRRGRRYHHTTGRYRALPGYRLDGRRGLWAMVACATPVVLGFVLPAGVLAVYAVQNFEESWNAEFAGYAANSLALAGSAAALAVGVGLFLAYAARLRPTPLMRAATRLAGVGYAVPGAVLAVGVMIPFARFDNALDAFMRDNFGIATGLLLMGSAVAVVFAYVVRFLAVSLGSVESALGKVKPSMEDAARTLGHGPGSVLRRVHLPLLRGGILAAVVLVFVDSMKELPATLILRPFNFDTLATYVYQFASDEMLEQCALGALAIVLTGVLPVIMLSRALGRSRPGESDDARGDPT